MTTTDLAPIEDPWAEDNEIIEGTGNGYVAHPGGEGSGDQGST